MADSVKVALALGGNLGEVPARFAWAIARLAQAGLQQARGSHAYCTVPVGCPPGTPDFWNAAVIGNWADSPYDLLHLCKSLEQEAGRPNRHPANQSRTLDLDLLCFGDLSLREKTLTLPHPEATRRLFVLIPLAELALDWSWPGLLGKTVGELLAELATDPAELARIRASARPCHLA